MKASEQTAKDLLVKADEAHAKLIEVHADALVKATEQTAQAISDKAAELLAESGTPPIESGPESNDGKMTEKQFWNEYREFDKRGDYEGKNEFYTENKHVIGQ